MVINFKNPDIKFYFSFQCPYSYVAWEMLKKLLKDSRLSLAPIETGLNPPGNTKFHFREIWGEPRWQRLIRDAEKEGLKISQPARYVSAVNAVRAIEAVGNANCPDYISSVFRAVFLARIDISLPTSLRLHLQSEGLDSSVLAAAMDDPVTEKKAENQQLLWGHERIRVVPTIELDGERYSGYIDRPGLERFLRAVVD
jgi:2-hydroxychromene-2-carboxylate isomerase